MSSLLSSEKLAILRKSAVHTPREGSFIEVGVYKGGSLAELASVAGTRMVFGFDTFMGLPQEFDGEDEVHPVGDFNDTSFEAVKSRFECNRQVRLIKGIFPQSGDVIKGLPISFAHLDMDYWRGTLAALKFIWPNLLSGGCILFDDYEWARCPGIAPVAEAWAAAHNAKLEIYGWQACLIKG